MKIVLKAHFKSQDHENVSVVVLFLNASNFVHVIPRGFV